MSQMFYFSISCEVSRTEGKFASRDDIADELRSNIEQADPGSIDVGEGQYEVSCFEVSDEPAPPKPRKLVTEKLKRDPSRLARLKVIERVLAPEAPYDAVAAVVLEETRAAIESELRDNPPRKRAPKAKPETAATEGAQS